MKHPANPPRRMLIVRTDRLGDVVLTLPMASAIRAADRSIHVSLLVNEYTRDIVVRCPHVDSAISISGSEGVIQLASIMRKSKADAIFIPSPRFDLALAAFLSGIRLRIGTAYRWYSFLFNRRIKAHRKEGKHHEAEHNLRMLSEIGISADLPTSTSLQLRSDDHIRVDDWLIQNFGNTSARYAVLHIPTRGSSMDWSHERFIELAKIIVERHRLNIVLTGTDADRNVLETIQCKMPEVKLFVGFSMPELAALLSRASVTVANSTGPGHLAAALGTPTVGLFPLPRPLAKERWGFRGSRARNLAPTATSGCPTCNNCSCMERIEVQDVVKTIGELLGPPLRD